jgi:hypothetical protein
MDQSRSRACVWPLRASPSTFVAATPHGHHAHIQSRACRDHEGRTRRGKKLPLEQAIPAIKAILAECILKAAAAEGQTSHESLVAAAAEQLPAILNVI